MPARILSIVVTASIVACPYVCKLTAPARASHGVASGACCCSHQHATPHVRVEHAESPNAPPAPCPAQPSGKHRCQGICGGAVFEDVPQVDASVDTAWWVDLPIAAPAFTTTVASDFAALASAPPPTGTMNPGRMLCCRYMCFLC